MPKNNIIKNKQCPKFYVGYEHLLVFRVKKKSRFSPVQLKTPRDYEAQRLIDCNKGAQTSHVMERFKKKILSFLLIGIFLFIIF